MVAAQKQTRSPNHPASLVDPALHSPALLELLDIKVSRPVIEYVVDSIVDTVDYVMGRPSSSSRRGRSLSRQTDHSPFAALVSRVLIQAEVSMPVILVALAYLDRAKPHLQIALEEWACERVFLGAIMVASKYLNDSTIKNVHWAACTGVFGKRDVGRIEREFLDVLDFELGVVEDDILSHHDGLSAVALHDHVHRLSTHRHASSQSRSHYHHRGTNAKCPVLDPSSPGSSSSSGSLSPRTPASPSFAPSQPTKSHQDVQLRVQSSIHTHVSRSSSSHHLALPSNHPRSYPIPIPTSHSKSSLHQSDSHHPHLSQDPFARYHRSVGVAA